MKNMPFDAAKLLKNTMIPLDIDAMSIVIIIAQIQLSLRHPKNNGPGATEARKIAEHLQQLIAGIDSTIDAIIQMGWNRDFDL